VLWYVAHMHHSPAQGAKVWHSVGPWMHVSR